MTIQQPREMFFTMTLIRKLLTYRNPKSLMSQIVLAASRPFPAFRMNILLMSNRWIKIEDPTTSNYLETNSGQNLNVLWAVSAKILPYVKIDQIARSLWAFLSVKELETNR